jgi:hypothetical protein
VTENGYRNIIIPAMMKPGEGPRQATEANSQFFWSMLNAKSEDIGRSLIKNFGGHHHKREENTVWRTVLILDEPDQRIWAETLQACGMRVAAASDAGSTPEIGCDDGTVVVPISECSARADSRFSVDLLPSRRP